MQYSHWVTESVVGRSVGGYCSGFDQLVCRPYFLLLSGGNCHFISWEGREINARRSLVIYAFCSSRRNARNETRFNAHCATTLCLRYIARSLMYAHREKKRQRRFRLVVNLFIIKLCVNRSIDNYLPRFKKLELI